MMCIIPWITDHNLAIFICNKQKLKKKKLDQYLWIILIYVAHNIISENITHTICGP